MIEQGEIYWVNLDLPTGSAPGYRHPCVVIQNNVANASRIHTGADTLRFEIKQPHQRQGSPAGASGEYCHSAVDGQGDAGNAENHPSRC